MTASEQVKPASNWQVAAFFGAILLVAALIVGAIVAFDTDDSGPGDLRSYVCGRLDDGDTDWQIAQDIADDSNSNPRVVLREDVLPAARSC